ncbi:hypothetical protein EOL70_05880 [Leucothrix sargassi]|nr:hypothetical protein EOL70_05880 [Leucothrix sargassi]
MKDKKTAAFWTLGIGVFLILLLALCPPYVWERMGSYGASSGRAISQSYNSWMTSPRDGHVIMVADAAMDSQQGRRYTQVAAAPRQSSRPRCLRWHTVQRGQTQWFLAKAYNNMRDKQQWLKGMRWISGKRAGDTSLRVGESVCVRWVKTV